MADPLFIPAIISGAFQAIIFNPIDRALYLKVHNNEKNLFLRRNFKNPFQGFGNVALYRTISSGSYFYFQNLAINSLNNERKRTKFDYIFTGFFAGTMNGILLNPMQIVKFQMWSNNSNFIKTIVGMYKNNGLSIFYRGVKSTIMRDIAFGVSYEILRNNSYIENKNITNIFAGCLSAIISSPFNYVRSISYGTPISCSTLSTHQLFVFLYKNTMKQPHGFKFQYLNSRLNIGAGSLRVGFGMAFGQYMFANVQKYFL